MDCPKMEQFWDDQQSSGHGHGQPNGHSAHSSSAYERNLNFSTVAVEDGEYGFPKKKTVRDPLSHRIIEKRRRDRMNNCLADLARLLPPSSLRKGRGRIEKTEIVELAIKHLKHLQCHPCPHSDNCEYNQIPLPRATHSKSSASPTSNSSSGTTGTGQTTADPRAGEEQFRLGFQESTSETMHFLVEKEGMYPGDGLCVRLVQHLNSHCDSLLRDDIGNNRKLTLGLSGNGRTSGSAKKTTGGGGSDGSISSGYQPNGSSGSGSDGNGTNGSNPKSGSLPSGATADSGNMFDLEGDQNSCSSAPLSLDITDTFSTEGKMTGRSQTKPPIPTIICSHSSSNNSSCTCKITNSSGSPSVHTTSSSNSDEGHSGSGSSAAHRYKFKNNIKQRFTADQTEDEGQGDGDKSEESPVKSRKHQDSTYKFPPSNTSQSLTETDSPSQYPSPGEDAEMVIDPDPEEDEPRKRHASVTSADGDTPTTEVSKKHSKTSKGPAVSLEAGQMLIKVATTLASPFPSPILTSKGIAEELLDPEIKVLYAPETAGSPEPLDQKPLTLPIVATVSDGKISALCAPPKGIPAFALHEKGLYYIPLTIDPSILAPFINAMDPASQPPLHPVTISVCFLLNSDSKKMSDFPPSPTIPLAAIPTTIRARVSDMLSVDLSKAQHHHHHQPHHGSKRESREFIMNRFAQSQVPMIFGSPLPSHEYHPQQQFSQEAIPAPVVTSANRLYPVAVIGRGGSISSSSSSSQQSSTYFNPNHKQHSPGHSNRSSLPSTDPAILYQHPGLNTSGGTSTTPYYPNSRSAASEAPNPPSSGSSSSSRNRTIAGSVGGSSGTHSSSHSHSSHTSSANRKRSISISPSVSSGYISWEGKAGKHQHPAGDPMYSEQTYVSGTLGDDHNHPPPRMNPRSYNITSSGGPLYPQAVHPHNPDHFEERHHEASHARHRSSYGSSHFYPDATDPHEREQGSSSGPSTKRAKKSRESIGEAGGRPAFSPGTAASRHTAP